MLNTHHRSQCTISMLGMRNSLTHDSNTLPTTKTNEELSKTLISISIDRYQEAVTFYSSHPNRELYLSYSESLSTCKELNILLIQSAELSVKNEKAKKNRSLRGMEREETLVKYMMQRLDILQKVSKTKTHLKKLKSQRLITRRTKKPH